MARFQTLVWPNYAVSVNKIWLGKAQRGISRLPLHLMTRIPKKVALYCGPQGNKGVDLQLLACLLIVFWTATTNYCIRRPARTRTGKKCSEPLPVSFFAQFILY